MPIQSFGLVKQFSLIEYETSTKLSFVGWIEANTMSVAQFSQFWVWPVKVLWPNKPSIPLKKKRPILSTYFYIEYSIYRFVITLVELCNRTINLWFAIGEIVVFTCFEKYSIAPCRPTPLQTRVICVCIHVEFISGCKVNGFFFETVKTLIVANA